MFWQDIGKVTHKVNERILHSKVPFAIRVSNHVYRRGLFVTMFIILVVVLGAIIVNPDSIRTVAYGNSMSGVGVGIYCALG